MAAMTASASLVRSSTRQYTAGASAFERRGCRLRVGALLLEQNDEWQLRRRYLQLEGLQALGDNQPARLSAVMS
jgi:hypothetical protein